MKALERIKNFIDGGPGSGPQGGAGANSASAKNFAKGLEQTRSRGEVTEKKFPKGAKVQVGSFEAEVIGHLGNIVQTTKGNIHISKLQK